MLLQMLSSCGKLLLFVCFQSYGDYCGVAKEDFFNSVLYGFCKLWSVSLQGGRSHLCTMKLTKTTPQDTDECCLTKLILPTAFLLDKFCSSLRAGSSVCKK